MLKDIDDEFISKCNKIAGKMNDTFSQELMKWLAEKKTPEIDFVCSVPILTTACFLASKSHSVYLALKQATKEGALNTDASMHTVFDTILTIALKMLNNTTKTFDEDEFFKSLKKH